MKKKISKKTIRLFKKLAGLLKPPEELTVSEWSDKYRVLSDESSSEPGKWRTDRAPYQRGILDSVSDPAVESVAIMSSAQIGKTEIINCIVGYYIDHDPCPMMMIMPTDSLAKTWSKKRLSPMLRDTPKLREKVKSSKSRDSDNTILEKGFPGGYIAIVGANSPVGLSSRPIRVVLADEVDRYPASAGKEGDPLNLAIKRTSTFWNKKLIYVSTPTTARVSRIEKEFLLGSQESYQVPCPVCNKHQAFEFQNVKFQKIHEKSNEVTDIHMKCIYCDNAFNEHEWKRQLPKGKWIAKTPNNKKKSFYVNALYSPWEKWDDIIEKFLESKKDKTMLQTWVNTFLGLPFEEENGEKLEHETLLGRRERYSAVVPEGVLVLTAGVDVQGDRVEVEVVGWGMDYESWGIEYKKIKGNFENGEIWSKLDEYLSKSFFYADGTELKIYCTCIDTGFKADEVYQFVKPREIRRIFGIKGIGGFDKPTIGKHKKTAREGINLFPLGVDTLKDKVYTRLKLDFEGPGYCHFPMDKERGYDEEYFKTLCSEKRIIKYYKGKPKFEWIKTRTRNEGLDLRNYATAAIEILSPNFEALKNMKEKGLIGVNVTKKSVKKKKRGTISKGVT